MGPQAKRAQSQGKEFDAWVGYFDVYGFRALLSSSSDLAKISEQLTISFRSITQQAHRKTNIVGLSDCFFIVVPVLSDNPLNAYIRSCAEFVKALSAFAEAGLFLRGGAAFGRVLLSNRILLGAPVVRAVEYEQLLPCPLVTMPVREFKRASIPTHQIKQKLVIDVQTKDGLMAAAILTPEDQKNFKAEVLKQYEQYRVDGPDRVALAWATACRTLLSMEKTK